MKTHATKDEAKKTARENDARYLLCVDHKTIGTCWIAARAGWTEIFDHATAMVDLGIKDILAQIDRKTGKCVNEYPGDWA